MAEPSEMTLARDTQARGQGQGIALMILAVASLTLTDVTVKWVIASIPAGQHRTPVFLRGLERKSVVSNCEAQQIMWEEGASIIPLFTDWLDARSESVRGWKGHPISEGDGSRLAEWCWLEA